MAGQIYDGRCGTASTAWVLLWECGSKAELLDLEEVLLSMNVYRYRFPSYCHLMLHAASCPLIAARPPAPLEAQRWSPPAWRTGGGGDIVPVAKRIGGAAARPGLWE